MLGSCTGDKKKKKQIKYVRKYGNINCYKKKHTHAHINKRIGVRLVLEYNRNVLSKREKKRTVLRAKIKKYALKTITFYNLVPGTEKLTGSVIIFHFLPHFGHTRKIYKKKKNPPMSGSRCFGRFIQYMLSKNF